MHCCTANCASLSVVNHQWEVSTIFITPGSFIMCVMLISDFLALAFPLSSFWSLTVKTTGWESLGTRLLIFNSTYANPDCIAILLCMLIQAHERIKSSHAVISAVSVLCPEGCEWSLAVNVTASDAGTPEAFSSFVSFITAGNLWRLVMHFWEWCYLLWNAVGSGDSQATFYLPGEMAGIPCHWG